MAVEYKHTLTVSKDVWFLRFYSWLWDAEPEKADVCRLFWGYLFAVPNLLARFLWLVIWPLRALLRRVDWDADPPPKKIKEDIPSRASEFFARPGPRLAAKAFGIGALIAIGAGVVGFATWGIVLFIPVAPEVGEAVVGFLVQPSVATVAAVSFGYVGFWVGLAWLDKHFDLEARAKRRKQTKHARGELTFGDMMVAGARAVKANTCPRLEVKEGGRSEKGRT